MLFSQERCDCMNLQRIAGASQLVLRLRAQM
jgi:hypothetical protein